MIGRWQVLLAGGLVGAASVALVPLEAVVARPLRPWLIRGAQAAQVAILVAAAVAIGERTAGSARLGTPLIDAWLAGKDGTAVVVRQIGPALAVGAASAGILIAYARHVAPHLVSGEGDRARLARLRLPPTTKLLYGGISEEIITRWGLVSLVAWALAAGRVPEPVSVAIVLAALIFALGHLPLVFAVAPDAPRWVLTAVVAGNFTPGIGFGVLFAVLGLEAAIMAHMAAHALAMAYLPAERR